MGARLLDLQISQPVTLNHICCIFCMVQNHCFWHLIHLQNISRGCVLCQTHSEPKGASIIHCVFDVDNILDDKPEGKSSADKEEQPVDEIPKRMKKSDSTTQSKGKVGNYCIKPTQLLQLCLH